MYVSQFDYYVDEYHLRKYIIDGREVFSLGDLALRFNENNVRSYVSVRGFIPYSLIQWLPEVNATPEKYLDPMNPYLSTPEDWAYSKRFGEFVLANLVHWETSSLSAVEVMKEIRKKKQELLAEHPEEFFLNEVHFFTIDGFSTFLKKATVFYNQK